LFGFFFAKEMNFVREYKNRKITFSSPKPAELGYHFMSVLGRHGTVKAEGSPEPLDSKWTASGRGKVTRDFCFSR